MRRTLLLIPVVVFLVAACASGATQTTQTLTPASPGTTTRVDVRLTDGFAIELSSSTVRAGVPVTFTVTNTGALEHEFYLGDEAAQAAHEQEMAMGGMTHDEPGGIAVKPGETKSMTFTFPSAGVSIAGCHVAGHYGAGMKANIVVEG